MNADLLTSLERCATGRKAHWERSWRPIAIQPLEMVTEALREALQRKEHDDYGELAGETVIGLAADRVIDSDYSDPYALALHHATLADILATHLRPKGSEAWLAPPEVDGWQSWCYMAPDGLSLRRVILVRDWDDERLAAECHSWYTLGEMAMYELPMTFYVLVIGQYRSGHRHSPWTKGWWNPRGGRLKFVKKRDKQNPLAGSWEPIWREDCANISRERWMDTMVREGLLKDLSLVRQIALPEKSRLQQIRDDIRRNEKRMLRFTETPPKVYSQCDWPVPCPYRKLCWGKVEREPDEKGFVSVTAFPALVRQT